MRDIWAFLLQTLTASGVAAFILIIKALLQDKLSPRWQFSVWGLLGLVLLIPAGIGGRYVLFDWPLLVETLKGVTAGLYNVTHITAPVPLLPGKLPASPADWIFTVYLAGVLFFLLRYLISYVKLRRILSRGEPVSDNSFIRQVGEQYGLPVCRAVSVPGLQTAFVCGIFKPVLALPAGKNVDPKVILHELMHLKYRDVVWGVVISLFRCIHWCNPFLWCCANRAMNDMESLCDQRVLEHLQGEERREYGKILLSMANDRYARVPGTSSAANGGKNIQRRIEAIVRFKKYPGGMALVSVCILVCLISPLLVGTSNRGSLWETMDMQSRLSRQKLLSAARLNPCTTPAGALDTYAKAILTNNGLYRAMCLPSHEQMTAMTELGEQPDFTLKKGAPEALNAREGYYVYNIQNVSDTHMEALLVMKPQAGALQNGDMRLCMQNVSLNKEGSHWYVEPMEDFQFEEMTEELLSWGCRELPCVTYQAQAGDFIVKSCYMQHFIMDNWTEPTVDFMGFPSQEETFQLQPKPDGEYSQVRYANWRELEYVGDPDKKDEIQFVGVTYMPWDGEGERPKLPDMGEPNSTGTSGDQAGWDSLQIYPDWDNEIQLDGGGTGYDFEGYQVSLPKCIAADLYINGEKTAELTLYPQEVTP